MSTQPLEQAISVSRGVLSAVSADQLKSETPCASWDVAALINHIVGGQHFFTAGMEGAEVGEAPDFAAGDYLAAFDQAATKCVATFQADGALEKTVKLPFGQFPGAAFMGLAVTDTFQHAWDLAKATGQDTNLAPELAAGILTQAKASIPDAFRGAEGAPFGQAQEAPAGASAADQLAAFLGRQI
jgi:uncharacterized protein (TIGR03086 family)